MFDAILYHGWFKLHAPYVLRGEGDENFSGYVGLPLEQLSGNRWAASRAVYDEVARKTVYLNKRPDFFNSTLGRYCSARSGVISDAVGTLRAWRIPITVHTVRDGKLTFWCVGHREGISELLDAMTNVGKKTSVGYGAFSSYTIEEAEHDFSRWHPDFGLMRPVTIEDAEEHEKQYMMMQYGIKPPYWKPKNARLCYVPVHP